MANGLAFPEYPESDTSVILLRFRSGVVGKVVTAFGFGRPQDHSVRVYGSDRCIENNLLFAKDGTFTVFARPLIPDILSAPGIRPKLSRFKHSVKTIVLSRIFERLMKARRLMPEYTVSSYPMRLYEHGLAVRDSLHDFLSAVREKRPPRCGVVDAARTVATCLAGVEAYRTNQTVSLEKFWLPEFGPYVPKVNAA
jgi:predicted dehydrogenase